MDKFPLQAIDRPRSPRSIEVQRNEGKTHAKITNLRGKTSPAGEEEKTTGKVGFHYDLQRVTIVCMVAWVSQTLILNNQEAIPLTIENIDIYKRIERVS